jgi:hypothetical protein
VTGARRYGTVAASVAALALLYGPFLLAHVRYSADPAWLNDGVLQFVAPFLVRDYVSDYYLAYLFVGYKALYRAAGLVDDPAQLTRILPYGLLLATLAAIWFTAARLGSVIAGAAAVALALSSDVLLDRVVGGSPRSFGFPLLAVLVAAMVAGRPGWLAAGVVAAAAFYPPMAVLGGLTLAVLLLGLPAADRGAAAAWVWPRRLGWLAGTAAVVVLLLVPGLLERRFGQALTLADLPTYPEMGPGGRYFQGDRAPFGPVLQEIGEATWLALNGGGPPWWPALRGLVLPRFELAVVAALAVTAGGLGLLARRDAAARRLAGFAGAAALAYAIARLVYPWLYLPQRYVQFPVPLLLLIGLPVAAGGWVTLVPGLRDRRWAPTAAAVAVTAAFLLGVGTRGNPANGFTIENRTPGLYAFLAALPPGTRVAGWPREHVDGVPFLARQPALVTFKTHEVFHRGYVNEMRRRTRAQVDATFATELAPLIRLRDEWRVTHLIVNRAHYGPHPPWHFKPFDAWTREAWSHGRTTGYETLRQVPAAAVWAEGSLAVLDLRRLPPP